jgi:hypothetical protein
LCSSGSCWAATNCFGCQHRPTNQPTNGVDLGSGSARLRWRGVF